MTRSDRTRGWFRTTVDLSPEIKNGAPVRILQWIAKGPNEELHDAVLEDPAGRTVAVRHPTWALVMPGSELKPSTPEDTMPRKNPILVKKTTTTSQKQINPFHEKAPDLK